MAGRPLGMPLVNVASSVAPCDPEQDTCLHAGTGIMVHWISVIVYAVCTQ